MDKFPGDLAAEIRRLRAEVDELKALLRQQSPLTSASAGWQMPNMATPATPASGGHLFASGSQPWWKDSAGATYSLKAPRGSAVPFTVVAIFNAPATYTQGQVQALVDAVEALQISHQALLVSLRTAPLIAT